MTHFVFGAAGLTGGALVERLLKENHDVVVVDLAPRPPGVLTATSWVELDICSPDALRQLPLKAGDTVHHLAARQYHLPVPPKNRQDFFCDVNLEGTRNILKLMAEKGCHQMVFFSTDMVYGIPTSIPVPIDAPHRPIGPYGKSKALAEELITEHRSNGMNITVFRPRLIVGPGRLGVLTKLFRLIKAGMPVPMIGGGANHYQMISVADCVTAVMQAIHHGVPNMTFNLGSENPPTVRELLSGLITHAGSKSFLLPTPAKAIKMVLAGLDHAGVTLMYPEQFRIADIDCRVDVRTTKSALLWSPKYNDQDMLIAAYDEYLSLQT
jgi:nucleoside-diphosphate-sugar epimerase